MTRHPKETDLALYAGNDLGWLARQRLELHLRSCSQCQQEITEFSSQRATSRGIAPEAGLPWVGVEWNRLAAEMKANIRLGLEAGSCVGPTPGFERPKPRWIWIPLAAAATLLFSAGSALWLNHMRTAATVPMAMQLAAPQQQQVVLEVKDSGIQVRDGDEIVSELRSSSRGAVVYSVNAQGGIGASYVDRDTGTVTVNNVYYGQ